MTSISLLPHTASHADVYRLAPSHAELLRYRRTHPAALRLCQAITQHRRRRGLLTTTDAFDSHRAIVLGLGPPPARAFVIATATVVHRAEPLAGPLPAPEAAAADEDHARLYSEQLLRSMHCIALRLTDDKLRDRTCLNDDAIGLVLMHLNRVQGPDGHALFLHSLFPLGTVVPDTFIDGRVVHSVSVLVRVIHMDIEHWAVAMWCRAQPHVVYTLDSASLLQADHPTLVDFAALCQQLGPGRSVTVEALPVAQQSDGHSCGCFAAEFCMILSRYALGPGINTMASSRMLHELSHVDVSGTRARIKELRQKLWIGALPYREVRAVSSRLRARRSARLMKRAPLESP